MRHSAEALAEDTGVIPTQPPTQPQRPRLARVQVVAYVCVILLCLVLLVHIFARDLLFYYLMTHGMDIGTLVTASR